MYIELSSMYIMKITITSVLYIDLSVGIANMRLVIILEGNDMRGRYNTAQREELLRYLGECESNHMTAMDIIEHLREASARISPATVYRHLDRLVDEGILLKSTPEGERAACYELINRNLCHPERCYHLKCSTCGTLIHLDCPETEALEQHLKSTHGFTLDRGRTVMYGTCSSCAFRPAIAQYTTNALEEGCTD